jgi:hypothetical protein
LGGGEVSPGGGGLEDFFAEDGDVRRGGDAQSDRVALDGDDLDGGVESGEDDLFVETT